ncbi:Erp protein [Corallococcus terminator]
MAKHMRRWMWAGAMAGTLALGSACSSTEAPIVVAQADTSTTGQPATGGSGSTTTPDTTTQDPMTQDPTQAAPGTVPSTPEQNPGSTTTMPGDSTTTTPDTTTTAPGTTTTPTFDGDAGMGGSGVVPGTTDDNSSGTFQPPAGGAVMDGGTF